MLSRRSFFSGLASALVAAPAIVRAASLMPVRGIVTPWVSNVDLVNRLIIFRKEIVREYVRQNLFTPYIGSEMTAIIKVINSAENGSVNVPLVARLKQHVNLDVPRIA